jgi:hypothetical protein
VSDGPTDQALLSLLQWLVHEHASVAFERTWADLRPLPRCPSGLAARVAVAIDLHPCDLLVVHRDAEREPLEHRVREIREATQTCTMPVVCAVPVRMTEAWLLFDERAIRRAAGCPNGSMSLSLPAPRKAESVPDPKEVLRAAVRTASSLTGRRLRGVTPDIRRLAELIDDFTPLRSLPSFQAFEQSLRQGLGQLGLLKEAP